VSIHGRGEKGLNGKPIDTIRVASVFTDMDGHFRIDGLIPGIEYEISYRELKPRGRGGVLANVSALTPGEERDVGEQRVKGKEQ
jgi:hypothetical protein